uniref:Tudor domain-containing protein n=1 Tax=Ditylenchus dipsaci TaxID=166011 RepID=A0A915DES9_9BILA
MHPKSKLGESMQCSQLEHSKCATKNIQKHCDTFSLKIYYKEMQQLMSVMPFDGSKECRELREYFEENKTNQAPYVRFVYVPDPFHGYVLGELIDLGAETFTVKLVHESKTMEIPYDNMVPAEEDQTKDADDIV